MRVLRNTGARTGDLIPNGGHFTRIHEGSPAIALLLIVLRVVCDQGRARGQLVAERADVVSRNNPVDVSGEGPVRGPQVDCFRVRRARS